MKKFKLLGIVLLCICFNACIQIDEEVDIKADGSGQMKIHTDMGKLFEMLKSFASAEDLAKEGINKAMDTTIMMKDIIDTAKNITAENKAQKRGIETEHEHGRKFI
jgi:alpha-L-arabinofuranosidase